MDLLERDDALALLAADLATAARGEGRTVLVKGEAGIGKTSLLESFVLDPAIRRVLWGACEALFTPHPLGPLHDLARESQGRLKAMLADGSDRAALFDAVLDELTSRAAPTVLVLEDIHWADAATLDLIRFIGRRIQRAPALMILSYRDDELDSAHLLRSILGHLPARHVTRIALARLSATAVTRLAAESARSDAGLYAATGGNPFFVTEVLASPDGSVPVTIREAVLGRAVDLDAAAREVLEVVAVVPRAIEASLLEAVLASPARALDDCIASGLLLAEGQTLRFRHELARVAVEESIAPLRARQLHANILAALKTMPSEVAVLSRLVHHAQLAGDAEAVIALAPRAAKEAAARGARREAAAHCKIALMHAAALSPFEHAMLLEEYAGHCFELNDLAAAIPAREEAIALFGSIGDRARQSESLARHAMPLVRALRNGDADRASREAIAIAETLPRGVELANAYATEAYLRMLNRDYRDAIAWGEKAFALADQCEDRRTLATAYLSYGAALLFSDYPRGCELVKISLAIARGLDDGSAAVADAYVMLGTGSGEVYQLLEAEGHLVEGIAFARTHDLDRLGGYMEAWQALVDVHRGRWDIAGERANALIAREVAGSTNRVMALVALGRLRIRRGDPGIDTVLDEALALAMQSGTLQRVAPVRCTRAEAAWLRQDIAGVRREAGEAFEVARVNGHPWFTGELAYWLWRIGDLREAPSTSAAPYALQIAGRWREAAEAWDAIGCPYESARALAEGDEGAQREALAVFDRLGANPLAERMRQQMREAGIRAVPRGPRESTRSNFAGLTTRELQILGLVAEGWQNAQIAEALSRSTRTIEHHIAAILMKLDAGTRNEAVAIARRNGVLTQDR